MTIRLDDRDKPLSYSPASSWLHQGTNPEYMKTTTHTSDAGATLSLVFNGTDIIVWGTVPPIQPDRVAAETSYIIDDHTLATYTAQLSNTSQYNQLFFQSGSLAPTTHTLIIMNVVQNGVFFLDYIDILLPNELQDNVIQMSSSVASLMTPAAVSSCTPSVTSATLTAAPATTQQPAKPNITTAVMVGALAAVAVMVLITAALASFRYFRRRKHQSLAIVSSFPFAPPDGALFGGISPSAFEVRDAMSIRGPRAPQVAPKLSLPPPAYNAVVSK